MKVEENFDNKYKVIRKIGINDSINVYLALHIQLEKQVIIKEYKKNKKINHEKIDILKNLRHPNIPAVFDFINTESGIAIISEFIDGETIDRLIQQNNPFSQQSVIKLAIQLISALSYLHSNNIICGNLKPDNIILTSDKTLILSDYCTINALSPVEEINFDNRGYSAPEQNGGKIDTRTDIYEFGAILFYMLTGISPSNSNSFSVIDINPTISFEINEIIIKCTQKEPEKRYQNFEEIDEIIPNLYKSDFRMEKHSVFQFLSPIFKRKLKRKLREELIKEYANNNLDFPIYSGIKRENIQIFLSYCHHDTDLADIICERLESISYINISRYTTDVPYKGSFNEFMNILKSHDRVIMIISDQYLKSRACMYEVGQLLNSVDFQKKILFVICSNNDKKFYKTKTEDNIEAQIYDPHMRNQYIIFWEGQCNLLESDLKIIKDECAKIETLEVIRDIKKIISHDIGPFMKYLGDAKGISFNELYQHDFKEFFDELGI